MWHNIDSLQLIVNVLAPCFTQPSFLVCSDLLLSWIMALGKHNLQHVGENVNAHIEPDHSQRHGLDIYYNFFERSSWSVNALASRIATLLCQHLPLPVTITLLVDDTLAHKRGKSVWGLGWWRDAVASTKKRVATASGHNWVVVALAFKIPWANTPILAFPLLARLHLPGKGQPSCVALAREMINEIVTWFPGHDFTLVGDGAYAAKGLLLKLNSCVKFVGRLRGDAAVYSREIPQQPKSRKGPKAKKGPRLPSPKQAAAKADRKRTKTGDWLWQEVKVIVYGECKVLQALSYVVLWPTVLGERCIKIVVVRDPSGKMKDAYLFTTDIQATLEWVITNFAWRWAIEVLFRSSKQELDLEAPQHWCQESVEKVTPWIWSMQSVIMVWYYAAGYASEEAQQLREKQGEWESAWSLRQMLKVLRRSILNATINTNCADRDELKEMTDMLKNWANLAA